LNIISGSSLIAYFKLVKAFLDFKLDYLPEILLYMNSMNSSISILWSLSLSISSNISANSSSFNCIPKFEKLALSYCSLM